MQPPTAINSVPKYEWTIKDHQTYVENLQNERENK